MSYQTRRILGIILAVAFVVAACGGAGASSAPSEAPTTAATDAPAATAHVALAENALGTILVDAEGMTLYGFMADTEGVPTCYEDCATAWPPLLGDASAATGEGLDASLLTAVERTDGTTQLKYGAWPLYYWASDTAPGDATGQGVGSVWFVIGADGNLIGAPSGQNSPDGY